MPFRATVHILGALVFNKNENSLAFIRFTVSDIA